MRHSSRRFRRRSFAHLGAIAATTISLACADSLHMTGKLPVAVLGNSDSHAYQDTLLLQGDLRGAGYRPNTFQWTEIWARLRPTEVDQGRWGVWGSRLKIARLRRALGMSARAPMKLDYEFNFALSGARCANLLDEGFPQAPALLSLMDRSPGAWAGGVVIIRIGINSVGLTPQLEEYAATGLTSAARDRVAGCVSAIERTVQLIRSRHPTTKIVLVSISDDRNLASNLERWRDRASNENIEAVQALFDAGLRGLAAKDAHAAFIDERAWFRRQWGGRTPDGAPDYRTVSLGGTTPVRNAIGDHPSNLTLADGHAGTVSNALWLNELIDVLNARWQLRLTPLRTEEIARLADPEGTYGLRAMVTPVPDK